MFLKDGSYFTCFSASCFSYATISTEKNRSLNAIRVALIYSRIWSCYIPWCAYHNLQSCFPIISFLLENLVGILCFCVARGEDLDFVFLNG